MFMASRTFASVFSLFPDCELSLFFLMYYQLGRRREEMGREGGVEKRKEGRRERRREGRDEEKEERKRSREGRGPR